MKFKLAFIFFYCLSTCVYAQNHAQYADSVRVSNRIPEISYAVITGDKTLEINTFGKYSVESKYIYFYS